MDFLNLLPFLLAALLHLVCCALGRQLPRKLTKVLLLPLLAQAYAVSAANNETSVFIALALGWLGDIFLIWPNNEKARMAGIAAFGAGHVFYILAMLRRITALPQLTLPWLPPVFFACAAVLIYISLLPLMPKELRISGGAYYLLLAALASFAGIVFFSRLPGGVSLLAGAALFLASDTVLCRQFFTVGDPAPRYDTAVMLTYILAQMFLVLGFSAV